MSEKQLVYRAGVIPYYADDAGVVHMLFMRPSDPLYGGDRMQIAKGRVDEGETFLQTALREGSEELGLLNTNISRIDEVGTFMGRTTVYVAAVVDPLDFGVPGFETSEVQWMTLEEFQREGRDLHVAVVSEAYKKIQTIDQCEGEEE